jgi:hypothetical protein
MRGLYVHVNGPWPHEAFLQQWGRTTARFWYGLIAWEAPVRVRGTPERLTIAAWVPADRLSRPNYVGTRALPRIELSDNRDDWPAPQQIDGDYYLGAWDDGEAVLPAGITVDSRPAWQRRTSGT